MNATETPTFRKDWPQAVAAGFDRVNDHDCYGLPTDEFLKGMAISFKTQKQTWEMELQESGVLESVYCDYRGTHVYVIPEEAEKIRDANREHDEYLAKRAADIKAVRDNKWYRKLFRWQPWDRGMIPEIDGLTDE